MDQNAEGVLVSLVPILLRINITIINIEENHFSQKFSINVEQLPSSTETININVKNDHLNFHNKIIYVLLYN